MYPIVRVHIYRQDAQVHVDSLMEIVLSGGINSSRGDSGDIKAALHHLLWLFCDSWTSGTPSFCQANHIQMEPD